MTLGRVNKTNKAPKVAIVMSDKLINNSSAILQRYLMPLGDLRKDVVIIGVEVPTKGTIKKADFEQEWQEVTNYCSTMGIEHIMVTIPMYMKHITKSKKAYRFEVAQGNHESVDGFKIYPLLNYTILSFQPDKLKLIQRALNHLVDVISGNVSEHNSALDLELDLIYEKPSQIAKALEQLLKHKLLTCDIETTGLRFEKDEILTISFSWNKKNAVCIAVHDKYNGTGNTVKRLLKDFFTEYYANGGQLIGHNFAPFDLPFIVHDIMRDRDFTINPNKFINEANIIDTLIMAYLTHNSTDRPPLGLKELAYTIMGNYDADIDQSKLIEYPLKDIARYNNLDVIANWYIYDRLVEQMNDTTGAWDLFEKYKGVMKTVDKMKMVGFKVDLEKTKKASEELLGHINEVITKLSGYPEVRTVELQLNEEALKKYNFSHKKQKVLSDFDEKFKAGSTNHKTILFRDVLGAEVVKVSKTTGNPSYDKEVLNEYAKNGHNDTIKEIASLLLEYNAAKIVQSNFLKNMLEGSYDIGGGDYRIFGNFNMTGTVSGRMSSSGVLNFLNLPSGSIYGELIKKCFVPPEGTIFTGADYSQLEDRALINVSKDKAKYKIFAEGFDSHCYNSYLYMPDKFIERGLDINPDSAESINSIKSLAGDLRQASKSVTFALVA